MTQFRQKIWEFCDLLRISELYRPTYVGVLNFMAINPFAHWNLAKGMGGVQLVTANQQFQMCSFTEQYNLSLSEVNFSGIQQHILFNTF